MWKVIGKVNDSPRVLIYSHDSFGLGHLRRCRAIAHALAGRRDGLSVLILSGSPIIGSFDFRTHVDFVRIPGVIKLRNGEYSSLNLHMDIAEVVAMRASIIRHTARVFKPDLFIVDKEPLGLRGEIQETLEMLSAMGTRTVLGLRDVMDAPERLAREWGRKNPVPALRELYDEIWVYGLEQVWDPLAGLGLPDDVRAKMVYTGYLPRPLPSARASVAPERSFGGPYLLVTTGGGGDGEDLVDWVISAYEQSPDIPLPALMVFGPFMAPARRRAFSARVERLEKVRCLTFDARVEHLLAGAEGVVAMGGYNTFCEILSFDQRALIVPRREPRLEQHIRASRAEELGLVRMLSDEHGRDPARMAAALRALPAQRRPSQVTVSGLLHGLDTISQRVSGLLAESPRAAVGQGTPRLAT